MINAIFNFEIPNKPQYLGEREIFSWVMPKQHCPGSKRYASPSFTMIFSVIDLKSVSSLTGTTLKPGLK